MTIGLGIEGSSHFKQCFLWKGLHFRRYRNLLEILLVAVIFNLVPNYFSFVSRDDMQAPSPFTNHIFSVSFW